jgi:hypothetical protein
MKFPKETLQELLSDKVDGFEVVEDKITYTSRWSIHYRLVFKHDGKFYLTSYSVGATESQDESPFEYSPDEVECKEVFPVEKTVIVYE